MSDGSLLTRTTGVAHALLPSEVPAGFLAVAFGIGASVWTYRRTTLAAGNFYLLAPLAALAILIAVESEGRRAGQSAALLTSFATGAIVAARRQRLEALGAGGELRAFELSRRMLWSRTPRKDRSGPDKRSETKTYVAGQGELVCQRDWPADEPSVPMSGDGAGKVSRRAGRHLLIVGATGSGKTVSARRWLLARCLADGAAVIAMDPKGDAALEADLRAAARAVGRPFVVFDPLSEASDRWNPLWSEDTGAVVSRLVAPIEAGDGNAAYYADLLQIHLGVVASGLQAAGLWPGNMPLLLEAAQVHNFDRLAALVEARAGDGGPMAERLLDHRRLVEESQGARDLRGGTFRLRVVAGETWRRVLTPDDARGAVTLPAALEAGAVVLVRTWVDDLPKEARAITTLFLADLAAAALAVGPGVEWATLIDEFGGVLSSGAGERALALMQRARSAGGQVAVTTQSIADIAAATENAALLEAMADNFACGIFHQQSAPDSRDWLARMIGTRELWQATGQTSGSGAFVSGAGSRRRVHEFLVRPDEFRSLRVGEAVVWTSLGPAPARVQVTPAVVPAGLDRVVDSAAVYRPCGPTSLPEDPRSQQTSPEASGGPSDAPDELPALGL